MSVMWTGIVNLGLLQLTCHKAKDEVRYPIHRGIWHVRCASCALERTELTPARPSSGVLALGWRDKRAEPNVYDHTLGDHCFLIFIGRDELRLYDGKYME